MNVKAGFWRANTDTTEVYPCLEIAACLGGPDSTCAKGYQGPICSECIGEDPENPGDFYARSGKYACQKCEASSKIALKLFGILVLVIAYVSGMVTIIILSANRAQ